MQMPTAKDLLLAWEGGLEQSPTRRAVAMLAAAMPRAAAGHLAALPVGARDARLFRLRRALFGETMAALAQCPVCGERLDVTFSIDDVCGPAGMHDDDDDERDATVHQLHSGGYDIHFRVPNSADLLSLSFADDGAVPQLALLRRCVSAVLRGGAAVPLEALPAPALAAIAEAMAVADPQARIELALDCPACGHAWRNLLDIAEFLWRELDAWAQRMLHDVHTLARAYGWSEADILALPARRRDMYLDMVRL
ncbi:hypothetical protein [Janthinobacterium fluminis]|uniref:Phage baseplate protein n=1 Tax=Janthinobacterium fluminis TaxID=2987524 RepID=A0ABT5JY91_9BURK|nr:hypothetical protein [Janthinobacterium fluminis]MDC8757016.1 hypothetical protein [Janthinobacterium fluminis]